MARKTATKTASSRRRRPERAPADRAGTILSSTAIKLTDDAIRRLEQSNSQTRAQLRQVDVRAITYLSDGLTVKGYLLIPRAGGKRPALIVNRGGAGEFGAWDDCTAASLARMAAWGYVVVASQFRGNAGGEGRDEFGGADVNDVMNLIPLLESLPQADAARIGMLGWSRGGMMSYQVLACTDRIAAAVIGAAATDLFTLARRRPEMEREVYAHHIPNYPASRRSELRKRSAVHWAQRLCKRTPILLLHGSADWRAHPQEAFAMVEKLYECQHPCRFVLFEGGDHALSEYRSEVDQMIRDWLDRYVRDLQSPPNMQPHGR